MNTLIRKTTFTAAVAVAAIALTTTSAFAHYCYNASRSDQGNAGAANGAAFVTVPELLSVFLCEEGVEYFMDGVSELDVRTDVLININTVMAGGLEGKEIGHVLLNNGKGIDHLPDSEAIDDLFSEAFAVCPGG